MNEQSTIGRLRGSRAYITGGASGLGAASAALFAAEGATVVIADQPGAEERAAQVVESILQAGGKAHFVPCDVTSLEQTTAAVAQARELLGGIDVVLTSAGVASHPNHPIETSVLDTTPEHWDFVLGVNLTGTLYSTQCTARVMIEQGTGGSIITIASVAAKRPSKGAYSVSKAGVWMLTRALSLELGQHGIRVNAIGPGVIDTPMVAEIAADDHAAWRSTQEASLPLGRLGQPIDVARTALFLASEDSSYFTGSLLHPDGGLVNSRAGG